MKKAQVFPAYQMLVTHTQLRMETFAGTFFVHLLCSETGSHCVRPGQPMNVECAIHIRKYLGSSNGSHQTL